MERTNVIAVGAVLAVLLFAVVARTQVVPSEASKAMPYHGYVENGGVPGNGSYDFQFAIYPSADPVASPVWSEQHVAVSVAAGNFSVVLGEGRTTDGAFATIWSLQHMYLGIHLCERPSGAECVLVPMAGRQRILSVASAVSSVPTGPLGQIMAVDFDAPDPDPAFWLASDGRMIPSDSRLGRWMTSQGRPLVTKDLTDDRFLMGATTASRGGNNDGHTHTHNLTAGNPHGGSPLHSHTHSYTRVTTSTECIEVDCQADRRIPSPTSTQPTSAPTDVNHTHPIAGTIGTGADSGDAPGSNRPRYQAVRYFVKFN